MSKAIVLLADGTGNSSANSFKTNVWKTYEAVDHGPAAADRRLQIAYYDNGVGTAEFRPLALLGGVFGLGLRKNVLEMYQYVCRNYRDGDDIYAFGFSRGAFTVRLVVSLIASQGLVAASNEAELNRRSRAAYRAFRRSFLPRRLWWPTRLFNLLQDRLCKPLGWGNAEVRAYPAIRFIGVWDTVSAYGGPTNAITRTIDNWFYALSLPEYELSDRVLVARHALALDDARESFHPILWDEVHEERLIAAGKVSPDRLQQVWFAGMHADVGGGYPDEGLSAVPLLWMLEEAELSGLRTLRIHKDRYVALADSQDRIHDSRKGLGIYYRYQPRRISAWLDPPDQSTLGLRDPVIADDHGHPRGLLRSVKIHESVIGRILYGTDRYAPLGVPASFEMVPAPGSADVVESFLQGLATGQAGGQISPDRIAAMERVWDLVWWRQRVYSVMTITTALLLAFPLFSDRLPEFPRTRLSGVVRLLAPGDPELLFLPDAAALWLQAYRDNLLIFAMLATVLFLCVSWGVALERRAQDHARSAWVRRDGDTATVTAPLASSWTYRWRTSLYTQRAGQLLKWTLLPDLVFAPIVIAFLTWLGLAVYSQVVLEIAEQGGAFCQTSHTEGRDIAVAQRDFYTRDLCSDSFGRVRKGSSYHVTFDVIEPWSARGVPTTPIGVSARSIPWFSGYLAMPMFRAVDANLLQPVIEIRSNKGMLRRLHLEPLTVVRSNEVSNRFEGGFTASIEGELFLFANDVVIPFGRQLIHLYQADERSRGAACVTVEHLGESRPAVSSLDAGVACRQLTIK